MTRSDTVTPASSRTRRSPAGVGGTGPTTGRRWTGSRQSSTTSVLRSAGPPITATSTPPPPPRPTPPCWRSPCSATNQSGGRGDPPRRHSCRRRTVAPPLHGRSPLRVLGRPDAAVGYAQKAHELEPDPRYDGFEPAWATWRQATGHLYAGRIERYGEISTDLAAQTSELAHVSGLCGMLYGLPTVGQAARRSPSPKRPSRPTPTPTRSGSPSRSPDTDGPTPTPTPPGRSPPSATGSTTPRAPVPFLEAVIARDLAELEAVHGDLGQAFKLFDATIDAFHRAGAVHGVTATLANLVTCLDRLERPEIAATIYGTTTNSGLDVPSASISPVPPTTCAPSSTRPPSTGLSLPARP